MKLKKWHCAQVNINGVGAVTGVAHIIDVDDSVILAEIRELPEISAVDLAQHIVELQNKNVDLICNMNVDTAPLTATSKHGAKRIRRAEQEFREAKTKLYKVLDRYATEGGVKKRTPGITYIK